MEQEKIENLLRELAEKTHEEVRPELATKIKGAIPHNLGEHKGGFHNVRIIIDLRVPVVSIDLLSHVIAIRRRVGSVTSGE